MKAMGGRITTSRDKDQVLVKITGGRFAERVDSHHAVLTCGECHQQADIERADGQPLRESDIGNALATFDHDCR